MKKKSLYKSLFPLVKYVVLFNLMVVALLVIKLFLWDVPGLAKRNPERTALMGIRGGEVRQAWVPLSRIAPALARGVVAAEDARFYQHNGIDIDELKSSWQRNRRDGEYTRGGSTIPMQLAKNLFLSPNKNFFRKGLEILIALKIDWDLPKERILEIYLNVIEWGDGIYGAEAAARHYFKKSAASLSAYEAAFLVAIVPSPLEWGRMPPGPYVRGRIQTVLARMNSVPSPDLAKLKPAPAPGTRTPPTKSSKPAAAHRAAAVKPASAGEPIPDRPAVMPAKSPAEAEQPAVVRPPAATAQSAATPTPVATPAAQPEEAEPQKFFLDDV